MKEKSKVRIIIPSSYNIFQQIPQNVQPNNVNVARITSITEEQSQVDEEEEAYDDPYQDEECEEAEEAEEEEPVARVRVFRDSESTLASLPGVTNTNSNVQYNENAITTLTCTVSKETRIDMKYGPLDEYNERKERKRKWYESEGINEHTQCQLCILATEIKHNDQGCTVMARLYDYERTYYLDEPDEEIFRKIAVDLNTEVFSHDQLYSGRNNIQKFTAALVSWHFDHSPKNFKRTLVEDVLDMTEIGNEMKKNHLFYWEEKNGVRVSQRSMDGKVLEGLLKLQTAKERTIKHINDLITSEKEGGPKKKQKTSTVTVGTQLKMWFGAKTKQ
jgi:hypothetical protein